MLTTADFTRRIHHRRQIEGVAAVLLPFDAAGRINYESFARHLASTAQAGLTPAVNMYTGYVNLLTQAGRRSVLAAAQRTLGGRAFVAGAYVEGEAGDPLRLNLREVEAIQGSFAFRPPVPAYKHSAAQLLKLRGLIACDRPHRRSPQRPGSDLAVLRDIAERLEACLA